MSQPNLITDGIKNIQPPKVDLSKFNPEQLLQIQNMLHSQAPQQLSQQVLPHVDTSNGFSFFGFNVQKKQAYIIGFLILLIIGYLGWRWWNNKKKQHEQDDHENDDVEQKHYQMNHMGMMQQQPPYNMYPGMPNMPNMPNAQNIPQQKQQYTQPQQSQPNKFQQQIPMNEQQFNNEMEKAAVEDI